jgi:hypothetical protein
LKPLPQTAQYDSILYWQFEGSGMKTNLNRVISLTSILFLNTAYGVNLLNEEVAEDLSSYTRIEAKFLYWRLEDSPSIIELVREGTVAAPATELVMGGERIHNPWRPGGKFGLIYWPKQYCGYGIQANYFFLPSKSTEQTVESSGALNSAVLSIPFFNVNLPGVSLINIASPGGISPFSGEATLNVANKMQGAELNVISPTKMWKTIPYNTVIGLRYWEFQDKLLFTTNSPLLDGSDVFETEDAFKARNKFLGLQLGSGAHYQLPHKAFLKAKGTVALGAMYSELEVDGSLRTTDFNAMRLIQEFPGGYFALPSNMGRHHRFRLAAIPEFNFKFGYNVDESFSWFIDYSFLYVTDVVWSGTQLNRNINPNQSAAIVGPLPPFVGSAQPEAKLNSNSLWIQGFALGFIYKL